MAKVVKGEYDERLEKARAKTHSHLLTQLETLRKIDDVSDELVQSWDEQLDLSSQMKENEKNIFKHKINTAAIQRKLDKAKVDSLKVDKDASQTVKDYHKNRKLTFRNER